MADEFLGTPLANILAALQANHPDLLTLLSKPGVFPVLMDMMNAEQAGHPWTKAQLDAALQQTQYYKTNDIQQRNWDILQATDPATATRKVADTKRFIDNLEVQLGVSLDNTGGLNSPAFAFLAEAVQKGWSDDQIKYELLLRAGGKVSGGDIAALSSKIKATFNDYGVPISDQGVLGWAEKLATGAIDENGILGYAQQQAKSLFPGLAGMIDMGISVRQLANPYLQIAAQELGIDPTTVSLTDPKWMTALNQVDPKTGQRAMMNLADWTAKIRSDPAYGYDSTPQAAQQGASLATQLAKMMGAVG